MNQQTAENYRTRINMRVAALKTKCAELEAISAALSSTGALPFLDEDRIVRAIGGEVLSPAPPATNGRGSYRQPNRGIRAQMLRYLMSGPATCDELAAAVTSTKRSATDHAVHSAVASGLISQSGLMLMLTDEGRKQGEWLLAHPEAKLYAAYLDGRKP